MEYPVFLENLVNLLTDATFVPFLAAGVVVLTNVFKWLFSKVGIGLSPALVALAVQVAVWAVYVFAKNQGAELQFMQWWESLIKVVEAFWPLVLMMAGSHFVYEKARDAGNPILGYSVSK